VLLFHYVEKGPLEAHLPHSLYGLQMNGAHHTGGAFVTTQGNPQAQAKKKKASPKKEASRQRRSITSTSTETAGAPTENFLSFKIVEKKRVIDVFREKHPCVVSLQVTSRPTRLLHRRCRRRRR
jgi:hypothetical protein